MIAGAPNRSPGRGFLASTNSGALTFPRSLVRNRVIRRAAPDTATLIPLSVTSRISPGGGVVVHEERGIIELHLLAPEGGGGAGLGIAAPDEVENLAARLVPIEGGHLLVAAGIVGSQGVILGNPGGLALGHQIHRFQTGVHSQLIKLIEVKLPGGFVGADLHLFLQEDVAGVDAFIHPENGEPRLPFAVDHRPVDGRGAAVFGEDGGVVADGPQLGDGQDAGRAQCR